MYFSFHFERRHHVHRISAVRTLTIIKQRGNDMITVLDLAAIKFARTLQTSTDKIIISEIVCCRTVSVNVFEIPFATPVSRVQCADVITREGNGYLRTTCATDHR
jgi:hypothetical protein